MKLARIVPPQWEAFFPTGEYRMALAHWVLKGPETYAKTLRRGADYIMMDNGTFEGEELSIQELNEAAIRVGADEVVLPDVIGDAKGTLQRSWKALGKLEAKRVMFVPQGRNSQEWRHCLHSWLAQWHQSPWNRTYALAIGLNSRTRTSLLPDLVASGFPFHLLGIHTPSEFAASGLQDAFQAGARGVDTSLAFAIGIEGGLLTPSAAKVRLGPPEQYEQLPTWSRRLVFLNLRILSEWVTQGKASELIPTFWIRQTASKWLKYWAEGFCDLHEAMECCGMPSGRYALLRADGKEAYIRVLRHNKNPNPDEQLMELERRE